MLNVNKLRPTKSDEWQKAKGPFMDQLTRIRSIWRVGANWNVTNEVLFGLEFLNWRLNRVW